MLAGLRAQLLHIAGSEEKLPALSADLAELLTAFEVFLPLSAMREDNPKRKEAARKLSERSKKLRDDWKVDIEQIQSWHEQYILFETKGQAHLLLQFLRKHCRLDQIDLAG